MPNVRLLCIKFSYYIYSGSFADFEAAMLGVQCPTLPQLILQHYCQLYITKHNSQVAYRLS